MGFLGRGLDWGLESSLSSPPRLTSNQFTPLNFSFKQITGAICPHPPTDPGPQAADVRGRGSGLLPPRALSPPPSPEQMFLHKVLCKGVCPLSGLCHPLPHHPLGPGVWRAAETSGSPGVPWAVGLPGDRDAEHLRLGGPLSESTTTHHPLPHRVPGSTTIWATASSSQGAPPNHCPTSLSPSQPFLTGLPVRGLGDRLGRVDPSC